MKKLLLCLIMAIGGTLSAMAQFTFFSQGNQTEVEGRTINYTYTNALPFFCDNANNVFQLGNQNIIDVDSVLSRTSLTNPNKLDYRKVYTKAEIEQAVANLDFLLNYAASGQYTIGGGKNGEQPGAHAYQYKFSLGADLYAQYGVIPHKDFAFTGITVPSTYSISDRLYGGAMFSFQETNRFIAPFINHASIDIIPELKAIYLLLYNYATVEVTDVYGPFPYNDNKLLNEPYDYDNVRNIYESAVANINQIVACLQHFPNKPVAYQNALEEILKEHSSRLFDISSLDDIKKITNAWLRFANSLKLRMAMRVVKAAPALAKKWAEEAVASGVIEEETQEAAFRPIAVGFTHPLLQISDWNDTRISASMESLLNSLQHPYLGYLFNKNSEPIVNTHVTPNVTLPAGSRVVGIRSGVHVGEGQSHSANQYVAFSRINPDAFFFAPIYLMKLSEVCFLRAEGAIRGWRMGGNAQDFYEKGIRHGSCEDRKEKYEDANNDNKNPYDDKIEAYIQLEHPVSYTYVDPTGDTPNMASVTKIGVKWNESDNLETKLEKIITQKYIAGFPYSFEAWADLRRTGYPKLFEVLNASDADGSLQQGDIIRRLPFPNRTEAETKKDIERTGLNALGGSDRVGTRLWWDVNKANF